MPRHIAFLRAINVGGHTVTMAQLRALFEALSLTNVETFIASGNVLFDAKTASTALERKIERHLAESLGYEVATFIRSPSELTAVTTHAAFSHATVAKAHALWIGFLKAAPSAASVGKLMTIGGDTDEFHVNGRELYWLRRVTSSESKVSGAAVERALGAPLTARNITTVRKLAAR
jgi:uncharacterized protein (DUF1697 family)